jgi:predicted nucleotide-binding protein
MARKRTPPTTPIPLEPEDAARLLKGQRDKGAALLSQRPIKSDDDQAWQTVTRDILTRAFGSESPNVSAVMDVGAYSFAETEHEQEERRAENLQTRLTILDGLIELLHSTANLEKTGYTTTTVHPDATSSSYGNRVFLVHGHSEAAIHETARWLERFGLDVVILREQPNAGRTIIEKFVEFSNVAFAIILLTGDDRGGPIDLPCENQKLRARQNVILELGFFLGKLGRKRVCVLYQEGVEIPSDYAGVLFVPIDNTGAWRLTLARELKAAELSIDLNLAV